MITATAYTEQRNLKLAAPASGSKVGHLTFNGE